MGMAQRVEGVMWLHQHEAQPVLPMYRASSPGMGWSRRVTWFWTPTEASDTGTISSTKCSGEGAGTDCAVTQGQGTDPICALTATHLGLCWGSRFPTSHLRDSRKAVHWCGSSARAPDLGQISMQPCSSSAWGLCRALSCPNGIWVGTPHLLVACPETDPA